MFENKIIKRKKVYGNQKPICGKVFQILQITHEKQLIEVIQNLHDAVKSELQN